MTEEQLHFEEEMATIQSLIGLGMKAAACARTCAFPEAI